MFKLVGINKWLLVIENGLVFQKEPIDGSAQVMISEMFRQSIFYNDRHSILSEHPSTRRMLGELRRHFLWQHMVADVQVCVSSCL